jgi:starch synthase
MAKRSSRSKKTPVRKQEETTRVAAQETAAPAPSQKPTEPVIGADTAAESTARKQVSGRSPVKKAKPVGADEAKPSVGLSTGAHEEQPEKPASGQPSAEKAAGLPSGKEPEETKGAGSRTAIRPQAPARGIAPSPSAAAPSMPERTETAESEPLGAEQPPIPAEAPAPAEEAPSPAIPERHIATAEAESVHVEEPVPDEGPTRYEEPAPYAHQGRSLFIVQIAPEMAPVAKVGGLADVVFGLSRELAIRGNHVEIVLPKYDSLRYDHIFELHRVFDDLWVPWYDGAIHCTVYFGFVHDRKCFFIEPHSQDNFFNRGSIYGFNDDVMRYAFFSRAAMEFLFKAGKHPDVIHCHDWQTALTPVLLYEIYQHLGMTHPRMCLTIHNFKHQGVTGMEVLRAAGLHQPERFFDYNRLRDNNNPHALNLLKGGIVYANFVTTVSPRYAFETKDQGQGFGLEPTLHTHHMKYGGVVNGIDYDVWNPEVDWHIPVRYGLGSIDGKYENKRALRHRLMLADNEKPIVAFIGRLDPQKGLELVRHAIFHSLERGAQFVLLGSSPDHGINADFWGLKHMLNDSPDCHLEIGFDEDLSHLIYAGADMMLVPSRFEPCGLTQLIALRYGTIPVVRAVGGLVDTVFDKDHSHRPLHERNGYVFEHYDQAGLESALGRAIACYYHHPEHFRDLMKNAMRSDNSWNRPGEDYLNIYEFIRHK